MANIKTRDAVKGTIKTIDKAAVASERMKAAYAKTKDKAEQGYYADENSATEYAADRVSYAKTALFIPWRATQAMLADRINTALEAAQFMGTASLPIKKRGKRKTRGLILWLLFCLT